MSTTGSTTKVAFYILLILLSIISVSAWRTGGGIYAKIDVPGGREVWAFDWRGGGRICVTEEDGGWAPDDDCCVSYRTGVILDRNGALSDVQQGGCSSPDGAGDNPQDVLWLRFGSFSNNRCDDGCGLNRGGGRYGPPGDILIDTSGLMVLCDGSEDGNIWTMTNNDAYRCSGGDFNYVGRVSSEDCGDGIDNDLDGDIDCADSDCDGVASGATTHCCGGVSRPSQGCVGNAPGWYDPPFWGNCGDCNAGGHNGCGGCGQARAYCDGTCWDDNWDPLRQWSYGGAGPGHKCPFNGPGCGGGEDDTCGSGGCFNGCSDGSDNDGDGYTDGQDADCGGCEQCTSGACCNTANGCFRSAGTACGNTFQCSSSPGSGYGTGGAHLCQGQCSGSAAACTVSVNCQYGDDSAAACACGGWAYFGAVSAGATPFCCGDDGGADNFYYSSGDPATALSLTCQRCNGGSNQGPFTFFGNGYFDDLGNMCYYGDITCNPGASATGANEQCFDACVNDNDGGPCTPVHNPAIAETCYYNDICQADAGCSLTQSGILRANSCDQCTPTGVVSSGYCEVPGTWNNRTCSYGTSFSCTGGNCDTQNATTMCSATNSSCCQPGTDLIHEGVSCNPVTGPTYAGNFDRDSSEARCESTTEACTAFTWSQGRETGPFGEYNPGNSVGCCGDDPNEFFILNPVGGQSGCCNSATDCIRQDGTCGPAIENNPLDCSDSFDNDCDGLIDEADPNCYGNVTGTVYYANNPTWVVPDAEVYAAPAYSVPARSAWTNYAGNYRLESVYVGSHNLRARKSGFLDDIRLVNVITASEARQDFYLGEGLACNLDCTDSAGNCNSACQGYVINVSGMNDSCNIVPECNQRPKGFKLTSVVGSNVQEITCCEGPTRTYARMTPTVSGNVDNLVDYEIPVKIDKRIFIMHILVWNNRTGQ